jgi:protein-tyrosine phosphatase
VRFLIEREGEGPLAVRVPDHAGAREVLRSAGVRALGERASAFGLGDGRTLPGGEVEGVAAVIDDGPTRLGLPSTTLRLALDGSVRVEHEGAMPERTIERRLRRTILFVCSGNTCRSPMAAAIARDLVARRTGPGSVPTRVMSAGTGALGGEAMTREAEEVLRERGIDPGRHRAEPLARAMVAEADVVYGMTRGHVGAVRSLDAGARAALVDPGGLDVPDPIGGPRSVYRETAARLAEAIARRLDELDQE